MFRIHTFRQVHFKAHWSFNIVLNVLRILENDVYYLHALHIESGGFSWRMVRVWRFVYWMCMTILSRHITRRILIRAHIMITEQPLYIVPVKMANTDVDVTLMDTSPNTTTLVTEGWIWIRLMTSHVTIIYIPAVPELSVPRFLASGVDPVLINVLCLPNVCHSLLITDCETWNLSGRFRWLAPSWRVPKYVRQFTEVAVIIRH